MVEELLDLCYEEQQCKLNDWFKTGWQEQSDFTSQRDDIDAIATYCMMSV